MNSPIQLIPGPTGEHRNNPVPDGVHKPCHIISYSFRDDDPSGRIGIAFESSDPKDLNYSYDWAWRSLWPDPNDRSPRDAQLIRIGEDAGGIKWTEDTDLAAFMDDIISAGVEYSVRT